MKIVIQYDCSSASLLQRRLSIGYARAARLIDELEEIGVIGPAHDSDPREVLIKSYEEFVEKREKWQKRKRRMFLKPLRLTVSQKV